MAETILVLNGHIDELWIAKELAGKKEIYCTDGAANVLHGLRLPITRVLGDLDSLDSSLFPRVPHTSLPDQNYTDFEKALSFLSDCNYHTINIYGASGGDVDHFLSNLSIAKKHRERMNLTFHDPTQYYFLASKETTLHNVYQKIISIIPFPEMCDVGSEGLQYPLPRYLCLGDDISVRNKACRDNVTISYSEGCGIIVIER